MVIERALIECKVRAVKLNPKGARIISIDLEWLSKVTANATKHDAFDMGAVIFRPKGSPKLYAVIDADDLLTLLSSMPRNFHQVS